MRESIEKERAREQIYAKMQSEYDALREEILHSTIENSMKKPMNVFSNMKQKNCSQV